MLDIPLLVDAASALKEAILDPNVPDRRQNAARWMVEGTVSEKFPPDPGGIDPSIVVEEYGDRFLKVLYPAGPYAPHDWPALPGAEELPRDTRILLGKLVQTILDGRWKWVHGLPNHLEQDEILGMLEQVESLASPRKAPPPDELTTASLKLIPGGFALYGKPSDLTGRPRQMLEALLNSPHRRCTGLELREKMGIDDEAVTYPEQVIRDTAFTLRQAFKAAMKAESLPEKELLRRLGKSEELTYILDVS